MALPRTESSTQAVFPFAVSFGLRSKSRRALSCLALLLQSCSGAPSRTALTHSSDLVDVLFVGDVLLDEGAGRLIAAGGDPFSEVASAFESADLVVANLECPIAQGGTVVDKIYTFRAAPATADVLARHVDAVSLANNHSGDYGPSALGETFAELHRVHVPFFGAGEDAKRAHAPLIIERGGMRIALLGYDEFHPRWFEATAATAGVAWSEDEQTIADIHLAHEMGAQIVIPFLHWGWENEGEGARQRELARILIDAGADAVIGAHPHVVQGAELYRGKPIVYSLGNFVFSLIDYESNRVGWMLRLQLDRRGVVRWTNQVVRIDDQGVPHPDPLAAAPCGERGWSTARECRP